jgi:3-methyladenine DNA glycosylase AlkC
MKDLDYLSAWNMVEKAKEVLKNLDFENIMKTTNNFIEAVNQMFDDDEETDFAIKGGFRKMRTSRKRRMPGELQRDERIDDPVDRYRVEVFRRVIDQFTTNKYC